MFRILIVGSGPSGAYCAQALLDAFGERGVRIDVIDRLPAPYGLVRYGVAPDHDRIKSITASFQRILAHPSVRFLGNVTFGRHVLVEDVPRFYDAAFIATGAPSDQRLGVPGEDLPGILAAGSLVSWYGGHPDASLGDHPLDAEAVAVIGNGNVALDIARILVKNPEALRTTDMPERVLDRLRRSRVRDVYVVGRRGPEQAKFSTRELLELGALDDVDLVLERDELPKEPSPDLAPVQQRMVAALIELAGRPATGATRRIHLRFWRIPRRALGDGAVSGLELEISELGAGRTAIATGRTETLPCELVVRCIGYRGLGLPGVPFDGTRGIIPNDRGRILAAPAAPLYVVGWAKRGPSGVIGTNKQDAMESVSAFVQDLPVGAGSSIAGDLDIVELLRSRACDFVTWRGWERIDAAEIANGSVIGRPRVKLHDFSSLMSAAAGPRVDN